MKKSIIGSASVFVFTFIALVLALNSGQKTYAVQMDSRFNDFKFYSCVRSTVGPSGVKSDGYTLKDSALNNVVLLICIGKNISSTVGLDTMKNLEVLSLDNNKITSIDLSKNTKLEDVTLNENKLTTLDLSKNTKLTSIDAYMNKLSSVNLTKNTKLTSINLHTNKLSAINLKNNTLLRQLIISGNKLKSIDLSKNTNLSMAKIDKNNMSSKPSICSNIQCHFGYIVKFESNGGSTVPTQNTFSVDSAPLPTRSGYTFAGWYKNSNLTTRVTFPLTVDKDTKLYAKWTSTMLAQEEEIVTNSNQSLIKIMIIVIAFFVAACIGYLTYTLIKPKKEENKVKNK